jgi:hypothetical protein
MFYFNLMLLQTGTEIGWSRTLRKIKRGRCRKLTPPQGKSESIYFSDTIRNPL